ncbi:AAA family ATPase [Vreelandella venusta]|uniref:AAA family ATPase n=1 Tax=Vreelandella venusta TaxID=44935 RepID=UPI002467C86C|nr:AAA family ATPase [Halomonas venusta]
MVKVSFAQDILKSDIEKYRSVAGGERATFFDRGVRDALYMLDAENALSRVDIANYVQLFPYNPVVFLLTPWEDIYGTDSERDQTFEESRRVFEGMKSWYSQWGYKTLDATSIHQASVA